MLNKIPIKGEKVGKKFQDIPWCHLFQKLVFYQKKIIIFQSITFLLSSLPSFFVQLVPF